MKNLLVVVASLAACNTPPTSDPTPVTAAAGSSDHQIGVIADSGEKVLSVNGTAVGKKELDQLFAQHVPAGQLDEFPWSANGRAATEKYAMITAMYDEAVKQQIWTDPEVQRRLAIAERQILAGAMQERMVKAKVTDQAINDWLEKNKTRFDKPEVKARQIQVASEELAKELIERIKKGEKFEELAKMQSSDKASAKLGGDVGWYQEQENRMFGKESFAAEKGALIGPIQSPAGWHIVEVLDKRESTPMEEIRPVAQTELARSEGPATIKAFRDSLKIEWVREPSALPPEGMPGMAPPGMAPPGMASPGGPPGGGAPPHGPGGPGKAPHGPGAPAGGPAPGGAGR